MKLAVGWTSIRGFNLIYYIAYIVSLSLSSSLSVDIPTTGSTPIYFKIAGKAVIIPGC